MTKPIPSVRKYMTTTPLTIGAEQTMADAHDMMRQHQLRHLPVLSAKELVGVVSDGDLNRAESFKGVHPERVRVEDVMSRGAYAVTPDAPLDEVVQEMARHKYGSAVVVDHNHVVGIFTAVDACQAFADMLRTRLA
jgi:acetoin utilization protein AcuB